ncbi:MAG: F0F1 ATP synthase subunit A [candidate division Zixibacteria bacterium]|nr:F0F1 ATP synthase subunit A [candidate division Zixibacteria bacterium]
MLLYYVNALAVSVAQFGPWLIATASGGEAGEHSGGHEGPPHLPNLVYFLTHGEGWAYEWVNVIFAGFSMLLMITVAMSVYKKRQMIPGPFQNAIEMMVEGMYNFIHSILGKDTKKYVPFLGTLFFYILINNWIGMVPFGHSPSTSLNITASLAILVFLYAQWTGISRLGLGGYIHHLCGSPADVISWCMVPLMLPLHIIGELAKPFSLALRLFGNITGEDTLIAVFVGLGMAIVAFSPVGVPLQLPFYFLGLLLSTIQALVFTLLSTIYILMMLPHEEHAH